MYGNRSFRGGGGGPVANADEDTVEALNTSLADNLSAKVSQLKNLALDLDTETRDHIPLLDDLSEDVEGSRVRMGGSSGRLRNLTRGAASRRWTCHVGLGIVMLLAFFYYVLIPRVLN